MLNFFSETHFYVNFSPRKNPNIAEENSPGKDIGDKSSVTFVSVVSEISALLSNGFFVCFVLCDLLMFVCL